MTSAPVTANSATQRHRQQARVDDRRDRGAERQTGGGAERQRRGLSRLLHGDAGEKQHDLAAFAHDRGGDGDAEHQHGFAALRHRLTERAQPRRHLARMLRHPHDVPSEHRDGQQQHRGREDLLTAPGEGVGDLRCKHCDHRRAGETDQHPQRHGASAPGHAARGGKHDADDKAGFENLTKDDDERCEHVAPIF